MYRQMIMGLIGEAKFAEIVGGLPNAFFSLSRTNQEALWNAILMKINEGINEVEKLIIFAGNWLDLFQRTQDAADSIRYAIF